MSLAVLSGLGGERFEGLSERSWSTAPGRMQRARAPLPNPTVRAAADTWATCQNLPTPNNVPGSGVSTAGRLYLFGGEVLEGFAFTMLIGIISGTYSTVFIASAMCRKCSKNFVAMSS